MTTAVSGRAGSRREPLRIANCSGYYGDRLSAAREMVEGGPIDVLTGDYLAELTMLLLWKARRRDPDGGYAVSFLAQMRDVLGTCLERGIKIVVNAGGLNPAGLAGKLRELAALGGLHPVVAHVEGDDLLARLPELQARGHDFAHLATGRPLAGSGRGAGHRQRLPRRLGHHPGAALRRRRRHLRPGHRRLPRRRARRLGASTGPPTTGTRWPAPSPPATSSSAAPRPPAATTPSSPRSPTRSTPASRSPRSHADGSSVITKHPGTGGAVTVGTVTAQLLYEIGHPAYLNADVVARFDTVRLDPAGPGPGRGRPGHRRTRARHAQGVPQPPRRPPQRGHLRAHRPRPRRQGRLRRGRAARRDRRPRPGSRRTTCGASTAARPTG